MIYLTYNDQPSGVYFSQVTDVCNFVNAKFNCKLRLVALISIRGFGANKKKIKEQCSDAIVLPMYPKNKNWRKNTLILSVLFIFIGKQNIWSRGLFATNIALELKKKNKTDKVAFDARGAYRAEFEEYLNKIVTVRDDIAKLENNAINHSDYSLAISNSLVNYWKVNYKFSSEYYSVIACTLREQSNEEFPSKNELNNLRNNLGIKDNEIVFIYSGSSADWQSLNLVDDFMLDCFQNNPNSKLIILANIKIEELSIFNKHKEKIIHQWVKPNEVMKYLYASDYGILIREHSKTNEVASPTKFAEYLDAGLSVLISDKIGDFSTFVKKNNCGEIIFEENKAYKFEPISYAKKVSNNKLSHEHFSKDNFIKEYKKIVDILS